MTKLKENYILFFLTAVLSALTSTGASAFQLGEFKSQFKTAQHQIAGLENKVERLTDLAYTSQRDKDLLQQELKFMKEQLDDIKKGVYALHK